MPSAKHTWSKPKHGVNTWEAGDKEHKMVLDFASGCPKFGEIREGERPAKGSLLTYINGFFDTSHDEDNYDWADLKEVYLGAFDADKLRPVKGSGCKKMEETGATSLTRVNEAVMYDVLTDDNIFGYLKHGLFAFDIDDIGAKKGTDEMSTPCGPTKIYQVAIFRLLSLTYFINSGEWEAEFPCPMFTSDALTETTLWFNGKRKGRGIAKSGNSTANVKKVKAAKSREFAKVNDTIDTILANSNLNEVKEIVKKAKERMDELNAEAAVAHQALALVAEADPVPEEEEEEEEETLVLEDDDESDEMEVACGDGSVTMYRNDTDLGEGNLKLERWHFLGNGKGKGWLIEAVLGTSTEHLNKKFQKCLESMYEKQIDQEL
tara:strand:- start:68 stop:1198 length:1131 start_codon:yes stop_codon:yes gene_type:complete